MSKKTVPSKPNFGMRTMIAFFLTNRTNPSSFSMPLVLKNNWKEIIFINICPDVCNYSDLRSIIILGSSACLWVYLRVESYRCSLCILRHFMSVVQVVGEGWLLMFVHQIWVGGVCSYSHCQQTVYYDICIPVRGKKMKKKEDRRKKEIWMKGTERSVCEFVRCDYFV